MLVWFSSFGFVVRLIYCFLLAVVSLRVWNFSQYFTLQGSIHGKILLLFKFLFVMEYLSFVSILPKFHPTLTCCQVCPPTCFVSQHQCRAPLLAMIYCSQNCGRGTAGWDQDTSTIVAVWQNCLFCTTAGGLALPLQQHKHRLFVPVGRVGELGEGNKNSLGKHSKLVVHR